MKASRKKYCLVSCKTNVFDLWLLLNGSSFKFCPLKDQMSHQIIRTRVSSDILLPDTLLTDRWESVLRIR